MTPMRVGGHNPIKNANDLLSVYENRYTEKRILLTTEPSISTSAKGILGFLFSFIDINIKISTETLILSV